MLDLSDPASRNLSAVLAAQARAAGDTVWLMQDERRETFAEVDAAVDAIAGGLAALGLRPGERVAILMSSRIDYPKIVIAVNRAGAIWVPINPAYRGDWLAEAIRESRPAVLIVEADYADRVAEVIDAIDVGRIVVAGPAGPLAGRATDYADLERSTAPAPEVTLDPGATAAILWTSGTTGRPKGVMQPHNAWIAVAEISNTLFDTRADDVGYNCLPLYNSAAWCATIFRTLVAGIPVGIDPSFSVTSFWDRIRHYGATQTMSLGAMHIFLLNAAPHPGDASVPLRVATLTPMPEHLIEPFCARFGVEKVTQGYGQSEVMTLLLRGCRPGEPIKPNSLGTINPDYELRLLDDEGNAVRDGETGEFAVRPLKPNVSFNGYFDNPEATAAAYTGDWYRTGDLGMRDADGDYFFVDRKKDYIRYKGRSISSFQVEAVAARFPAVAEAAAYGVPCAELESEHEIKLDVVAKPGVEVEPEALARFINDNAPFFLVPRYIEVVAGLPHTPTNKVEKYKLRARGLTPATWDRLSSAFTLAR